MPEYQIQLVTRDAQTLTFACDAADNVISAAQKADIFLAAQCGIGACGACMAVCQSGEFQLGAYSSDALPPAAQQERKVLLCCTYPRTDLQLNVAYDYNLIRFAAIPQRQAVITRKTLLTPDTLKLDLQLQEDDDGNLSLDFEPGQFIELFIPNTDVKRAYSLANAPNWDGTLELLIKLRPHGQFSTYINDVAQVGTALTLNGAQGTFVLADRGLRPRYFVAGGCGLASVMSMLRRMAEWQEPHEVRLFFGVWREDEVFYQQELADLAAEYPNFHYQICVTQSAADWAGYHGSAADALAQALQHTTSKPDIYICGSLGLIERVAEVAAQHGIARDELIHEHYASHTPSNNGCDTAC